MPLSFNRCVKSFGLPALVITIGTFSSIMVSICCSISGYNSGTFTAKGLSVAFLHRNICSLNISGYMLPLPIVPKPPALLTADAKRQPLTQIIPACMIGFSIPSKVCMEAVGLNGMATTIIYCYRLGLRQCYHLYLNFLLRLLHLHHCQ